MEKIKPKNFKKTKLLVCDWTDKKKYLIHYRMLKFYITHGMVVDKVIVVIPFRQSKWLEKNINFNTQKRNSAGNDFEKGFYELHNNAFHGKTKKNVRNRVKLFLLKRMIMIKILISNQNKRSIEFMNFLQVMIVIHLNRMKFLWINRFILGLVYQN